MQETATRPDEIKAASGIGYYGDGSLRLRIGFVLARRFTLSAFALFVDTLRLASDVDDRSGRCLCDWDVLARSRNPVAASCGTEIVPTARYGDPAAFDYVVVVGGLLDGGEPLDAEGLDFLRRADALGVPLVGLCTGSFILAGAGLMDGHTACVSWLHRAQFHEAFPQLAVVSDRIFVAEGNRATCAGGAGSADLAAYLVRRHVGPSAEKNALSILQIGRARDGAEEQPGLRARCAHGEPRVRAALTLMEQHLADRLSVDDIAAILGVSRRQLERLFQATVGSSPAYAYIRIRLEAARELVMHSRRNMMEIALDTGFESHSHFSRCFSRHFGMSPSAMRRRQDEPAAGPAVSA